MENKIDGFTISFTKKVFPSHDNHELPKEKADVKVDFSGAISPDSLSVLLDRTSDLMTAISAIASVPMEPRIERIARINRENPNVVQIPDSAPRRRSPIDEESSDSDDDLPDLVEDDIAEDGEHKDYAIEGTLNQGWADAIDGHVEVIRRAWRNFSSVMVTGRTKQYRVVFPAVDGSNFEAMTLTGGASTLDGHSWPICSCEAYHYRSFGRGRTKGCCRHITALLNAIIPGDVDKIVWDDRPECLPYHLKQRGVAGYEWVPELVDH